MKTILIVGINGFLGSHLAKSFKDNFKIIGLTSNTNNLSRIDKEEFEVFSSSDKEIHIESLCIFNLGCLFHSFKLNIEGHVLKGEETDPQFTLIPLSK